MCRYAIYGPYKDIFACFGCRKSFKQTSTADLNPEQISKLNYKCPQCHEPMVNMGHDFKAPKQIDKNQWRKVKLLYDHGIAYHSCGCDGPGYRPTSMREVQDFLAIHNKTV
ncbi:hypothetical protein DX130_08535 [Paenibacillus paeoniae]|uniref:Uncharacterized protein n=1 Tax=Paenibacillus paeoniae TaxID=2292705 RepID=A0A371PLF5_9BACL|nr:hypothetical protein [Paenibacillus paeoniae]REK77040.1 hypothetical protein DX130_08535 [Paenibacillus paeoniae]